MSKLIYTRPATFWKQALPLGNGKLGMMVYGGKKTEKIAINDGTLWSGYPKDQDNPESLQYLDKVRQLIFEGKNFEADKLAEEKLIGHYCESFMPLGNIKIKFGTSACCNYSRELNLDNAIFTINSSKIQRQAFASYPDNLGVYHITSIAPSDCVISLSSKLHCSVVEDETINLVGQAPDYVAPNYLRTEPKPIKYDLNKGMAFCLRIEVQTDGTKIIKNGKLTIKNATQTTLYIVTSTGFCGYDKMPSTDTKLCITNCINALKNVKKDYKDIYYRHLEDYSAIYRKQTFEIASTGNITTDKLVKMAKKGQLEKQLIQDLYNFGKYMTIAGSRKGGQPLNLQGIWNSSIRPPWSSNYTTNINAQMNYWGTSASNLSECLEPYVDMVYEVMQRGKKTAQVNYGCKGSVCNHNVDIWRKTAPVQGDANYMLSPMCGVWLANELYEHLSYGQIPQCRDKIIEIVKQSAIFVNDFLVMHDGNYVICPSPSPENVFINDGKRCKLDYASAYDMGLTKQCFNNYLEIDSTSDFAKEIIRKQALLYPFKSQEAGICEWHKAYPTPEKGHRHFSPLYALHPGRVVGYHKDKETVEDIRRLFDQRINNIKQYFGWSGAWAINLAARLHDGEMAKKVISNLMAHSIFSNLFDVHPPFVFQIDGNFGYVSGINEMLVSVEDGVIELLPAIPSDWKEGKVVGMVTATGHIVSFEWANGIITSLSVEGEKAFVLRKNSHIKAENLSNDIKLI